MSDEAWRSRLAEAVKNSGRSKRAISLATGSGPGYVHSVLAEGKDPTVDKLIALCHAINVSPAYILHGIEVTPAEADLLAEMRRDPEKVESILRLLTSRQAS